MPLFEKLSPNSARQAEENCRRRQTEEPVCGLRTAIKISKTRSRHATHCKATFATRYNLVV